MSEKNAISLFELNKSLKTGIKKAFPDSYWVMAEISELNINQSGHCYLELIEKNSDNEQIIAKARATIWAFTFRMLRPYFESVTKQKLAIGIKIMVLVNIEFHELYGYSLNIKDIEPVYTLGDLSRIKAEIIERLTKEGVFHLNKELELTMVPQRIAVISSETAAGYGDFTDQLKNNKNGYSFYIKLFQAYMQGNEAEQSIIQALENIFHSKENFDCVVIIRGGGSQTDLNCFNSYWLCYHITQFPVPVITGIGHERDETITDLVAHTSLKTPTAVAEFLLEKVTSFDGYLEELKNNLLSCTREQINLFRTKQERLSRSIVSLVKIHMNTQKQHIASLGLLGKRAFKSTLLNNQLKLSSVKTRIIAGLTRYLTRTLENIGIIQNKLLLLTKNTIREENKRLGSFENTVKLLDPAMVLKRGYTMTFLNGTLIKSVTQLKQGDAIENVWHDGHAFSTVGTIRLNEEVRHDEENQEPGAKTMEMKAEDRGQKMKDKR